MPVDRTVIGVGNNKVIKADIYDSDGINISDKNPFYCELTALYWIWKNSVAVDFVGLEHYRRFFCGKNIFIACPMRLHKINKILNKYDIILPKQLRFNQSIYEQYKEIHFEQDLQKCFEVIKIKYPDYVADFNIIMGQRSLSPYNMFVMSRINLDKYCQWLFDILFEIEKLIDFRNRDSYQKRVFGFLAERLFNIWVHHQKLKVYYAQVWNHLDIPFINELELFFKKIR